VGVGDDNLTVDHGVQWKGVRPAHELRERDTEVLQVPAEDPRGSRVRPAQQTAEAIELRLVAPLGSARQGGLLPRQHRHGHARQTWGPSYRTSWNSGSGRALGVELDVTSSESARAAVEAAIAQCGGPHILVNNGASINGLGCRSCPKLNG